MDEFLEDRIYDVAQECGFITHFDGEEDYVTFEAHSPLGLKAIGKYFDVDEHAVFWYETNGKNGAPKDLKKLLKDARCIKIMYQNLYLHMRDLYKELEEK